MAFILYSAEKVLSGETKLCLTTSSLSILASNFRRYSENAVDNEDIEVGVSGKRSKGKQEDDIRVWNENIRTLMDFVMKVTALKVSTKFSVLLSILVLLLLVLRLREFLKILKMFARKG